ncbi:hypothetical protein ODR16_26200, partial [Escherichia coli]|nr:hypothetical protein [Escherichia coli]
ILKNKKYLAREDNPLTRITRTVLYIYIRKIAFRRGDRNPYNPLLMGLPAPSNFYTREIKKMRHAGGRDADMGIHITGYP